MRAERLRRWTALSFALAVCAACSSFTRPDGDGGWSEERREEEIARLQSAAGATARGYLASRDYLNLVAYTSAMGIPTGLLVHCNSDRAPENEIVIRNAGTRILCRPIRLDGSYQGVSRSIDALADLVRELAEFPGEFVVPQMLRTVVR